MLLLFVLSSFSFVENNAIALSSVHLKPIDSINNYKDNIAKSTKNFQPKNHLQVSLTESVALTANGQNNNENNQNVLIQTKHGIAQQINLEEKISIIAATPNQKIIFIVTKTSERITTLERIFNLERLRFGAKNIVANDVLWIEQVIENKNVVTLWDDGKQFVEKISAFDLNNDVINLKKVFSESNNKKVILVTGDDIAKFSKFLNTVNDGVKIFTHNVIDPKNPIAFLLLVPLSGNILIHARGPRFEFVKLKARLVRPHFCLIVIIIIGTLWVVNAYAVSYSTSLLETLAPSDGTVSFVQSRSLLS